ncbi:HypC/HybG/HupF family hydrogenase formation chaperone [Desulfocurvibacter africanus]|uniref:Hydrogenase assembly chaperone hypC/hupF n=1 Tax=Desulfocurvibacter africanus subsp. africanus str. Walvis Bay TaxID=690850 RepID=F3Z314_DESAF|nr:HypC/HybG/HupF family hydrogenase formation chaperone [Desulfocurvibacter africanus]EGJ51422.1 hydrogenase assembly chaperone hypC/hupF [Desulfocurvibacter africanus subsp. africanus str. Walvis Bay]
MCLAIPARIEEIEHEIAKCRVGEGETFIKASLTLLAEEVAVGDYLIVHAGFALRRLDANEAEETLRILRDIVQLMEPVDPSGLSG